MPRDFDKDAQWDVRVTPSDLVVALTEAQRLLGSDVELLTWSTARFRDPPSRLNASDLDEFRREICEPDATDIIDAEFCFFDQAANGTTSISVKLGIYEWPGDALTRLTVSGTNRTSVEGVFAQLDEFVARLVRAVEQTAISEAAAAAAVDPPVSAIHVAAAHSSGRGFERTTVILTAAGVLLTAVGVVIAIIAL